MEDRAKHSVELEQRQARLESDRAIAKGEKHIAAEVLANGRKSKGLPSRPNPTPSQFLTWEQDLQKANEKYERVCSELSEVKAELAKLANYGIQPR